jgi:hypothetical protein
MDSPFIIALLVFFGIFLMFVFISLLSDLVIVGVALACAVLAYYIPGFYPEIYEALSHSLQGLRQFGIVLPEQLDSSTHYLLAGLIVLGGTLICIPVLPFSATYRQMLGANKLSSGDEIHVKRLVAEELERLKKKLAEEKARHHKSQEERA